MSDALADVQVLSTFAGPGGWCEGLRAACPELHDRMLGVELDDVACATRAAAGHRTLQGDVRAMDPKAMLAAGQLDGLISSPPCPTFSSAGLKSGMADYQEALDALTCLGEGCGCAWHELPGRVADIRTALVVEPLRWIMALCPKWVLLEQVPEIEFLWEDLAAELFAFGYQWVDVRVLDAADYGCISHRRRAVLMAHADCALFPEPLFGPGCRNPHRTPGSVLGLHGTLGFARRNDRPDGGLYRARDMRTTERPAFTVTEKIRSWSYVPADGSARRRLTLSEVAQMQSFPADYPFQGSWTRACLQAANAMPPLLAAQLIAGARYDQFDVEAAVGITPEPVSEPESPPAMPVALTLF